MKEFFYTVTTLKTETRENTLIYSQSIWEIACTQEVWAP